MAQDGGVDPHGFHRTRFSRPVPEPSGVILLLVPGGRIELPSAESKSAVLTAAPARLLAGWGELERGFCGQIRANPASNALTIHKVFSATFSLP